MNGTTTTTHMLNPLTISGKERRKLGMGLDEGLNIATTTVKRKQSRRKSYDPVESANGAGAVP